MIYRCVLRTRKNDIVTKEFIFYLEKASPTVNTTDQDAVNERKHVSI